MRAGLEPVSLEAKEGLALVNGTQGMLAVGTLALDRVERLCRTADVVAAMTIEAALGTDAPFDERLQLLRPHPGQATSAANLRRLLEGSPILASHRDSTHLVQDAYSLRCAPQVHGATRDTAAHAPGCARDRGRRGERQPDRAPGGRRGPKRRELPRDAGGCRSGRPGAGDRRPRIDLATGASTGCSTRRSRMDCRRSWCMGAG